jgi:hypothetical protein
LEAPETGRLIIHFISCRPVLAERFKAAHVRRLFCCSTQRMRAVPA